MRIVPRGHFSDKQDVTWDTQVNFSRIFGWPALFGDLSPYSLPTTIQYHLINCTWGMAFITVALHRDVSLLLEGVVHPATVFKPDQDHDQYLLCSMSIAHDRDEEEKGKLTCLASKDLLTRHRQEFHADPLSSCTGST